MPLPTDPMLNQQWHLGNSVAGRFDLNVRGVWNPAQGTAYNGAGTRVVVIDNGFDFNHSDLAPNYNQTLDFDFENNTLSAFGFANQGHGTAVMGIIGAAANGTGAVGIAYGANLVGYRTANLISDAWLQDIRDSIASAATSAFGDVISISQGIANDDASEFGVGYNMARFTEIRDSIGTATGSGRGGLGTTIVKSAGNSRADLYDVNADLWTNDTRQVVVAAVNQDGTVSSYSSYGAALLVSAFGTPGEVVTTDRVGAAGYTSGDFTTTFNGTSAAAPMVSGIVSLMYDANAGLGWRDVQTILANTARHVGSDVGAAAAGSERYAWGWNHASTWNGGGLHFSNDYGYGLVDALAAVRLAESWSLTGLEAGKTLNQVSNLMDVLNVAMVIPDGNATGTTFIGNAYYNDIVDRVSVKMTFSTTFTGDMNIFLTSPDGTVSRLIDRAGGGNDFNDTWTFESQAFRGERAAGNWSVRVVDAQGIDQLTVSDIVIRTFGTAGANDRYIFTNEYSDYDGVAGHRTTIFDNNGGTDEVNAAAVTSASTIRLDGVAGSIDGVAVTFTNGQFENAIGGDAGDTIVGNAGANKLFGMRGDDHLFGRGGADVLNGGAGSDWAHYDLAAAGVTARLDNPSINSGEAAGDSYVSIENLVGSNFGDVLGGNGVANQIYGMGGDDHIESGAGADFIDGGAGNDFIYYNTASTVDLLTGANAGGAAGDVIGNVENVIGSNGVDVLRGTNGNNYLFGSGGVDHFDGRDGADTMDGGTGIDTVYYNTASTVDLVTGANAGGAAGDIIGNMENIIGSAFVDVLRGTTGVNYIFGGGGNDHIEGRGGGDTIDGGAGIDQVYYNTSSTVDLVTGANGGGAAGDIIGNIENIYGSAFFDVLRGTNGNNEIYGQGGEDHIDGRGGGDFLVGGSGNDFFYFTSASLGGAYIGDFNSNGDDTLMIVASGFGGGLSGGGLAANRLVVDGGPDQSFGQFLYNSASHVLTWDSDGTGGGGSVVVATLGSSPSFTNSDIWIL